jgi:prepilin-type N-terminal cleavage/methylation domain-containing protein
MRRQKGFTLIEILFAVFIGVILMGAAYVAMTSGQQTSAGVERKVSAQQDVRAALQTLGLDLSMASYNPNYVSGIWRALPAMGATCSASPNQEFRGIQVATGNSILVEMDIGESSGVGDPPDRGEMVLYTYNPAPAQFISRETINCDGTPRGPGAALPFLGSNGVPGQPKGVRVINDTLGIPVFQYFDAVGEPAAALNPEANPAGDIPRIRRIDITLAVETDEVDPSTKQPRRMIYSSSVFVRNHAIVQ